MDNDKLKGIEKALGTKDDITIVSGFKRLGPGSQQMVLETNNLVANAYITSIVKDVYEKKFFVSKLEDSYAVTVFE